LNEINFIDIVNLTISFVHCPRNGLWTRS